MKSRFLIVAVIGLVIVGSCATYFWFNMTSQNTYKNSLFVERGASHGYAEMYNIHQSL